MLVWLNGRWLRAQDARVPALDRGLLHGDGLYDTWRTYDGVPFAVAAHIRRLTAATRVLRLPTPGPAALWERLSRQIAARNGVRDAAVRLTLTRGAAGELLVPERAAQSVIALRLGEEDMHRLGREQLLPQRHLPSSSLPRGARPAGRR